MPPVAVRKYSRALTIALAIIEAVEDSSALSSLDRGFLADRVLFVLSVHDAVCPHGIRWLDEAAAVLIDELASFVDDGNHEAHVGWSCSKSEAATILAEAETLCRAEMEAHDDGYCFDHVAEDCYRIRSTVDGSVSRNVICLRPMATFRRRLRAELLACLNDMSRAQPTLH